MIYATWNPSDKHANIVLSNGDLTAAPSGSTGWMSVKGTIGVSSGKWYWEFTFAGSPGNHLHGVAVSGTALNILLSSDANSYVYRFDYGYKYCAGGTWVSIGTATVGDVIGVALDMDNGKIWFAKNGTWLGSGDPANGTNPACSGLSDTFYAVWNTHYGSGATATANFGASSFSHTVPSGFTSGLGEEEIAGTITCGTGMADVYDVVTSAGLITCGVGMSDEYAVIVLAGDITDGVGMADVYAAASELPVAVTDGVGFSDEFVISYTVVFVSISETVGSRDDPAVCMGYHKILSDALCMYGGLKWAWSKIAIDSMDFVDALESICGMSIKDWMTITDTESNNWKGSEPIADSWFIFDVAENVRAYYKLISENVDVTDAANMALRLMLVDIFACIDTPGSTWTGIKGIESTVGTTDTLLAIKHFNNLIADGMSIEDAIKISLRLLVADKLSATDSALSIGKFQHLADDSMTIEDIVSRAFPRTISDSMDFTDVGLIDFLALLQISDSFTIAETNHPGLTIKQIVSDAFESLDAAEAKILLQELIQDGMALEVSVVLDGELWECWVLNTSAFHVSVYSGYNYNSYAVFNDTAYGCKSDGIYELSGDDDDGTEFHSGIILPQTKFGADNKKRFRRAWMGVSGNDLTLKVETESGSRTYSMVDTEIGITRDLKGRSWTFSLEDFDSLDSISLVPVILSKR